MPDDAAKETVEQLIVLTEQITRRISQDADAFEARRTHEVAGRIEETVRLANLYRRETARVRSDPGVVLGAPRPTRERLARASEAFETALKRHGRALYAVKTVTEGIVRAIAEEVVRARAVGAAYGPGARGPMADATAVTLNRMA